MYCGQAWVDWLPCICLLFSGFPNVCHFTCIWPRALKLGCITNVDMLFLTMGFICLFYENKFMLISGGHISNRSIIMCILCNIHERVKIVLFTEVEVNNGGYLLNLFCKLYPLLFINTEVNDYFYSIYQTSEKPVGKSDYSLVHPFGFANCWKSQDILSLTEPTRAPRNGYWLVYHILKAHLHYRTNLARLG